MSHQYHDRGAPYGKYDRAQSPRMGPPPPRDYSPDSRQHRPAPLRVPPPRGPPPGPRGAPMRPPPQQQYAPDSMDRYYDGSAYGGADEFDQWPLPARPFAPSGRNSPGGSPRGGPRRPMPQRPQRPDYQDQVLDPPRPTARIAPAERSYRQPPPPQSYHGSGQWTGEGYRSPQPPLPPPNRPLPQSAHPPPQELQQPQALRQAVYAQQRNQRAPLGPPPSARRGPAFDYPLVAPVHPIAEETDSMRGSIRNASLAFDPAHSSYASSNAIPIGVPGFYLEERGSGYSNPNAVMRRPSADQIRASLDVYDEPPLDPMYESEREGGRDYAESPSPEPAALIRQASLGKRTKPTLTTVKSGERMGESQQRQITPPKVQVPVPVPRMDQMMAKSRISNSSSEDSDYSDDDKAERSGQEEKALEAASAAAAATAGKPLYTSKTQNVSKSRENLSTRTPSSGILSGGTGLLDSSSTEESEKAPKKRKSRELLGAMLGQSRGASRSRSRSPLSLIANSPIKRDSVAASSPRDPGTPNLDALQPPSPVFAEGEARRRPPKLDLDAVRDAEARGSLTSLTDLIRRAGKLRTNLDRGRTASRLGMSFFEGMDSTERALAVQEANRRSGSISDILGSFPAPGLQTPQEGQFTRFSKMQHSQLPSESDVGEIRAKGRRCCGMPVWLFSVLMVFVILLVCAAVLVPVVLLVVLPNQGGS